MNLFKTQSQPKPTSNAASRYRQYIRKGRGSYTIYLPPARDDELSAKLAEAEKLRDEAINSASERRAERARIAKETFNNVMLDIDREHRTQVAEADDAFVKAENALLAEYARPLTAEEVALLTTKPGEIVRVPAEKAA